MAAITVIRDPNIEQSKIYHALRQPSAQEAEEQSQKNPTEYQQTKIFGLLVPILALNGVAVDFQDVEKFELDCTGKLPVVKFTIHDRSNIISNYSNPGNDNELRLQILPRFDNTYKKIDLTFMCTDVHADNGSIIGTAEYKLTEFTKSLYKALGQLSTYELCDKISTDTGLGFAANTEATEDARYMQCQYESYKDLISREIYKSGSSEVHVFDWWVDTWNNLILCDIYDRINSEDTEADMQIWITQNTGDGSTNDDALPTKALALFSNHPALEHTDLYVQDYDIETDAASQSRGNSVALSVYEENKKEWIDHYITDGDIQKNEFVKFEYAGEVYGDYNYLLAEKCRDIYLKKIESEVIVIHTAHPQLGIMRGDQLRFVWYDNDAGNAMEQDALQEAQAIKSTEDLSTILGWVKDWDFSKAVTDSPLRVNLQYSGQYTCIGQYISYNKESQSWDCWLYLSRPASKRPQVLNDINEQ
jgi:hypothetical protein